MDREADVTAGFVTRVLHAPFGWVDTLPSRDPTKPWPEVERSLAKPTLSDITDWLQRINEKYAAQLGQPLNWDESSPYHQEIEIAEAAQDALFYVAGRLAVDGPEALQQIDNIEHPSTVVLQKLRRSVEAMGFQCRFPQLLLRVDYWLPFERDLIIEEPDWSGKQCRFGSLPALRGQLDQVMNALQQQRQSGQKTAPVLDQAISCARALTALSTIAWANKLPLWRISG